MGLNYQTIKEVESKLSLKLSQPHLLQEVLELIFKEYRYNDFIEGYNEVCITFNTNKYCFSLRKVKQYDTLYEIIVTNQMLHKASEVGYFERYYIKMKGL